MISLAVRNIIFTLVVPGAGAVFAPWWILTHGGASPVPQAWYGAAVIAAGAVLYTWCISTFAVVGRGTPGPWDAPRRFVAVGPYRWVRNPMYISALLVVAGESWLFLSVSLLEYAVVMAGAFHLFVIGYEEPTLRGTFGGAYAEYLRTVSRWIPRPPRS